MAEVVTRGTGEHEQLADRAVVRVTFAARGADRAAAVAALGPRVAQVEAVFARDGVEVRSRRVDVRTAWERSRRVGSTAQLVAVLRLTRVDVVEGLLESLIAAEPESLSGPHWELTDDAAAVTVAQQRAVADARRRAEGYAAALGMRLGPLQRLSEPEQPQYGGVALAARSAESGSGLTARRRVPEPNCSLQALGSAFRFRNAVHRRPPPPPTCASCSCTGRASSVQPSPTSSPHWDEPRSRPRAAGRAGSAG